MEKAKEGKGGFIVIIRDMAAPTRNRKSSKRGRETIDGAALIRLRTITQPNALAHGERKLRHLHAGFSPHSVHA